MRIYFDISVLFEGCGLSVLQVLEISIVISSLMSSNYIGMYIVTLSIKSN